MVFTDDDEVRRLNRAYRGLDRTTDVLSFAQLETVAWTSAAVNPPAREQVADPHAAWVLPHVLGDIVISVEQAQRQAPEDDLDAELLRLVVHGLCHLRGYDHHSSAQRKQMEREERRLLALIELDTGLVERAQREVASRPKKDRAVRRGVIQR